MWRTERPPRVASPRRDRVMRSGMSRRGCCQLTTCMRLAHVYTCVLRRRLLDWV